MSQPPINLGQKLLNWFKPKEEAPPPPEPKKKEEHIFLKGTLEETEKEERIEGYRNHEIKTLIAKAENEPVFSKGKFTEPQQLEIVKMLAHGMRHCEIVEEMESRYPGIKISSQNIYAYQHGKKWAPVIKSFKSEFETGLAEVAGSSKRVRMERYERIYARCYAAGKWKEAIMAIQAQRTELEKDGTTINFQFNQYNTMTDEELEMKKQEMIQKLQAITIKPVEEIK